MTATSSTQDRAPRAGVRRRTTVIAALGLLAVLSIVGCSTTGGADPPGDPGAAGHGTIPGDGEATAVRTVRHLDQILRRALVVGDTETVEGILAPDFVDAFPAADGATYRAFRTVTPVAVRVSGGLAVVTYEARVSVMPAGTHRLDGWYTHVYEKRNGGWRMVWAQETPVRGDPSGQHVACTATTPPTHRTTWSRSIFEPNPAARGSAAGRC